MGRPRGARKTSSLAVLLLLLALAGCARAWPAQWLQPRGPGAGAGAARRRLAAERPAAAAPPVCDPKKPPPGVSGVSLSSGLGPSGDADKVFVDWQNPANASCIEAFAVALVDAATGATLTELRVPARRAAGAPAASAAALAPGGPLAAGRGAAVKARVTPVNGAGAGAAAVTKDPHRLVRVARPFVPFAAGPSNGSFSFLQPCRDVPPGPPARFEIGAARGDDGRPLNGSFELTVWHPDQPARGNSNGGGGGSAVVSMGCVSGYRIEIRDPSGAGRQLDALTVPAPNPLAVRTAGQRYNGSARAAMAEGRPLDFRVSALGAGGAPGAAPLALDRWRLVRAPGGGVAGCADGAAPRAPRLLGVVARRGAGKNASDVTVAFSRAPLDAACIDSYEIELTSKDGRVLAAGSLSPPHAADDGVLEAALPSAAGPGAAFKVRLAGIAGGRAGAAFESGEMRAPAGGGGGGGGGRRGGFLGGAKLCCSFEPVLGPRPLPP
ncbi:hypothetical protein Rsub_03153 [Raphidocelis subcapitata]|uniref:Uncharacterized protein n=1 Tax=Raphidocelis subcapitata TaxID=307507 RepID=A0A2V0NSG7_9CHLO|nr:hypothetical protein Rsub_03153 [Raphidocelis subcapitata]|eukprot:GBF90581.1 hypothetical protein Rsub_03153 [Raphidocelis subcapitata]